MMPPAMRKAGKEMPKNLSRPKPVKKKKARKARANSAT